MQTISARMMWLALFRVSGAGVAALQLAPAAAQSVPDGALESITIARSWREARSAPTELCTTERSGFAVTFEDKFSWRAIVTGADGQVTNRDAQTIGGFFACFGVRPDRTVDMYIEGDINSITFRGNGLCVTDAVDKPQAGLLLSRCHVDLRDLPAGYVGGYLTSNGVNSRNVLGGVSDPPGYTQASIATIRLWRDAAPAEASPASNQR